MDYDKEATEFELDKLRRSLQQKEEEAILNEEKINTLEGLINYKDRQLDVIKYQTDLSHKQRISLSKPRFYSFILFTLCLSVISFYYLFDNRDEYDGDTPYLDSESNHDDKNYDSILSDSIKTLNVLKMGSENRPNKLGSSKSPKPPQPKRATTRIKNRTEKPKFNFINSLFKKNVRYRPRYKLTRSKANLYKRPEAGKLNNVYVLDKYGTLQLTAHRDKNGFVYVSFPNNKGGTTRGWLRKKDLRKLN